MKNLKSVSALVLLALSFTACEKNDSLPTPAPPPAAERKGQVILPIWNLRPIEVRDATGSLEVAFTYDSKKRLSHLHRVGEEMLTFEYNSNGSLMRVNHFDNGMVSEAKNATSFDLYTYNNPNSNKPTKISRYANSEILSVKFYEAGELKKIQPNSIIEITYDGNQNKISEKEFTFLGNGLGKGVTREQTYTYDNKNNVTSTHFFEHGVFRGEVQFKLFDTYSNMLLSLPVINLLPFQFTGTNNATLILSGNLPEAKLSQTFIKDQIACGEEVQKKFEYNDYGYPISETTITKDGSFTSFIKYHLTD